MEERSNYGWRFMPNFEEGYVSEGLPPSAETVDLPFAPILKSHNHFEKREEPEFLSYEKTFDADPKEGFDTLLRMEGAFHITSLYLNGEFLESKNTSFFPTVFDLTALLRKGKNRLLLVVDAREREDLPPFGGVVDYRLFGGIYRPLEIETRNENRIEDLFASGAKDGSLRIETALKGEGNLSYELFDEGRSLAKFEGKQAKIDSIVPWSLSNPKLYRLCAYLKDEKGSLLDSLSISVGFRDAEWKKDGFYLNGRKTKLIGLNRHMNYPFLGSSAAKSLQEEDALILKDELGVNVVRTSHYPQSEAFLSACDKLGLLTIDEVPGWQHVSQDEAWRETFLSYVERMVRKERNHPSLIAYGVRVDESKDDHDLYSKSNEIAHHLDPYRQTLGVRNFKTSETLEDIYAYNDFSGGSVRHGLDRPESLKYAKGKPLLISEYCGHMFPTKAFDGPRRKEEHVLRHLKVLDDLFKYDRYAGGIGWCAFDYPTNKEFGSGDFLCYHGVCDCYRLPKDAAFAYSSNLLDKPILHIVNNVFPGDGDECLMRPLLVLTNCDCVKLYSGENAYIGTFYPDKKRFPHLPHPPIAIDDWIGESFKEPRLSKRASKRAVALLNKIASKGVAHLAPLDYLKALPLFLWNGFTAASIEALYYKYVTSWGQESKTYRIVGYKDGKVALEKRVGAVGGIHMRFLLSKETLQNEKEKDAILLRVSFEDDFGNPLPYYMEPVSLSLEGPLLSLGPKETAAIGGHVCFYIGAKDVENEKEASFEVASNGIKERRTIKVLPSHQRL